MRIIIKAASNRLQKTAQHNVEQSPFKVFQTLPNGSSLNSAYTQAQTPQSTTII